jgi:hypothetical protein
MSSARCPSVIPGTTDSPDSRGNAPIPRGGCRSISRCTHRKNSLPETSISSPGGIRPRRSTVFSPDPKSAHRSSSLSVAVFERHVRHFRKNMFLYAPWCHKRVSSRNTSAKKAMARDTSFRSPHPPLHLLSKSPPEPCLSSPSSEPEAPHLSIRRTNRPFPHILSLRSAVRNCRFVHLCRIETTTASTLYFVPEKNHAARDRGHFPCPVPGVPLSLSRNKQKNRH